MPRAGGVGLRLPWVSHRRDCPDPVAALRADLRTLHVGSRGTYGRPRMVRALRACAHAVGHKRVARLMREEGLRGKTKLRFTPRTTDSRHGRLVAENRLDRQFAVDSTVPAWAGDITYIPTREGWLYLATVLDLRTRAGARLQPVRTDARRSGTARFLNAWSASPVGAGVLFHSDRGSQYTSDDLNKTLAAQGFVPSMSRKGNCWDNAIAESLFATVKNEEATGVYETRAAAQAAIASYIHGFYNPTRLHSALGYLSPNDYDKTLKQAA